MPNIALLASGSGTTAEAVIEATQDGRLDARVALIVHNNPQAGVQHVPIVRQLGITTLCINGKTHPGTAQKGAMTDAESQAILDAIETAECSLVALLGYMKQVRGTILEAFGYSPDRPARMINTHAGPLPQTGGYYGAGIHRRVYELFQAGELEKTGPTLHQVSAKYDEGPVIQFANEVIIKENDTPDSIEEKVRAVERRVTPLGINSYLRELQ